VRGRAVGVMPEVDPLNVADPPGPEINNPSGDPLNTPSTVAVTESGAPFASVPDAVSVCVPTDPIVTDRTNTPLASAVAVPTTTPLSVTVTVDPGAKPPAEKVTDRPGWTVLALTEGGTGEGPG